MKSASEALHEHLTQYEPGYEFTAEILEKNTGFSRGSVTGFIAKAVQHGMVQPEHKIKRDAKRSITMYTLIDPDVTWKFKPKSHGSYKGRIIKGHAQIELPLAEPESLNIQGIQTDIGKYDALPETSASYIRPTSLPSINPTSSRLIDIAAEVERLENKSLKDYSTDEILAELGTRLK